MHIDKIKGQPDGEVAWGSDIAAQMLRRFKIPFVSLNPGASYRGFHDSLVNHLGNENPGMLLCLHEDHAVAVAHGYAKVTDEPMACVLHSNVGLMHGMMALFNAWLDRVPMIVMGATGPIAAEKRRPWIDWIHTSRDQGGLIRSIIKWDDLPSSPEALIEAMARANIITRTAPTAPVYICLDAGLQESKLDKVPEFPDLERFVPAPPSRPSQASVDAAKKLLDGAKKPIILFGRNRRSKAAWDNRIKLAERLGACVMTDLKNPSSFPTDNPHHVVQPFNQMPQAARQAMTEADVILSLDWVDLAGALKQAKNIGEVKAKIIHATLDGNLHSGAHMDYQGLAPVDVSIGASPDEVVTDLVAALGPGKKAPWRDAVVSNKVADDNRLDLSHVARALDAAFETAEDKAKVSFCAVARGWPTALWPFRDPLAYFGKDGGGGIGSGPGISVGCALALQGLGRYAVTVLGDGDFAMGSSAIWTAARHRIPMLIILNNNRSYFNDELHQETVAVRRNREVSNRWIGQRISDPDVHFAKLAESYGVMGIGPVKTVADIGPAMKKAVEALKAGGTVLLDCHVDPGEDRKTQSALGHRKTD